MPTLEPPSDPFHPIRPTRPEGMSAVLEDGTPFEVRPIDKAIAKDLIVREHYSHNWNIAFGVYCFGVFDGLGLAGALVYGNPMNPGSVTSLADLAPDQVTELNRMWVHDRLGPNTETAAMARAHKWLRANSPVQLIQTFADGRLWCGTVYKAANFTYYGHDETLFFRDLATGEVLHGTTFSNTGTSGPPGAIPRGMLTRNQRLARGDLEAFYVKTHRYLYPLTKYARRHILLREQPYPAYSRGTRPVPGYVAPATQMARCLVIAGACGYADVANDIEAYLARHYSPSDVTAAIAEAQSNPWVSAIVAESDAQADLFGLLDGGAA